MIRVSLSILIAGFFAYIFNASPYIAVALFIFILLVFVCCRFSYIYFLCTIFILFEGFGFFPAGLFSLPGVFKLQDLFFVGLFFPPVLFLLKHKKLLWIKWDVCAYWVLSFMAFCLFQMIRTKLIYDLDAVSIIQTARYYFYYLFFFLFYFYVRDDKHEKLLISSLLVATAVSCLILVFQTISGVKIFFSAGFGEQELSGFSINRVYPAFEPLIFFCFSLAFYRFIFVDKHKLKWALLIGIYMAGGLAMFSRARWLYLFLTVIFLFLTPIKNKLLICMRISAFFITFILFSLLITNFDSGGPLKKFFNHASSIFYDFTHRSGTFGYRLMDSSFRLELAQQHPFFGVGFVHGKKAGKIFAREMFSRGDDRENSIGTADSGLITLFAQMGISGILVFLILIVILIRKIFLLFRTSGLPPEDMALVYAIAAYIFAGVLTFITLGLFTVSREIILLSMACWLLEKKEWKARTYGSLNNCS